jgi:hypothetical protein
MCTLTLIELKVVNAQAEHSDSLNKISSGSTAQDEDFWEVKERKKHN